MVSSKDNKLPMTKLSDTVTDSYLYLLKTFNLEILVLPSLQNKGFEGNYVIVENS